MKIKFIDISEVPKTERVLSQWMQMVIDLPYNQAVKIECEGKQEAVRLGRNIYTHWYHIRTDEGKDFTVHNTIRENGDKYTLYIYKEAREATDADSKM